MKITLSPGRREHEDGTNETIALVAIWHTFNDLDELAYSGAMTHEEHIQMIRDLQDSESLIWPD